MSEAEQQQIRSSPYMSPMHNYGSSIITMTNPDDELFKMELTFRSQVVDAKGNVQDIGDPLMNELGINSVIGIVQSIVNRVTVMSNLNKYDIPMLIDFWGDTLAKDLMMNRIMYEIKTSTARDKIYFTSLSSSHLSARRMTQDSTCQSNMPHPRSAES